MTTTRIAGAVTDSQVREFISDAPAKPTRLQVHLVAEALGRAEDLISAGYRSIAEYLRHMESDISDGRREAPEGYQGEPEPAGT